MCKNNFIEDDSFDYGKKCDIQFTNMPFFQLKCIWF